MTAGDFLDLSLDIAMALMALAVLLGGIRLWLGPDLGNRVVALDMMSAAVIGFCALYALKTGVPAFLDIALAVALTGFVPLLAFARYAAGQAGKEEVDD